MRIIGLLILCCYLPTPLWAQAPASNPDELFAKGVQAFRAHRFAEAAQLFGSARDAGLQKPALFYNLGVALYRSGELEASREAFERAAADERWGSLSRYNLGLIAQKQSRNEDAHRLFEQVLKDSSDQRLRKLAQASLRKLGAQPQGSWFGVLALGVGRDSNVSLSDSSQFISASGNRDEFLELTAVAIHPASEQTGGWEVGLDVYRQDYRDLNEFDQTSLGAELRYLFKPSLWSSNILFRSEILQVDAEQVQHALSIGLESKRKVSSSLRTRLSYRYTRLEEDDPSFASLTGNSHKASIRLRQQLGQNDIRYTYHLQIDDREDLNSNGDFYSQSPTRHGFRISLRRPLGNDWKMNSHLEYLRSNYDGAEVRANVTLDERQDREWNVGLSASRPLFTSLLFELGWTYSDNESNFNEFSYSANVLRGTLYYTF